MFPVLRGRSTASLGAYESLPTLAIEALLAAGMGATSRDPFVACAALAALAIKDDDRVLPALVAALGSDGPADSPQHRPVAQAAAWALFDRTVAGKSTLEDPRLVEASYNAGPAVAGPLALFSYGGVAGQAPR